VQYQPRFLREQRAVYVVTADQLELRERPRRAERDLVARFERAPADQIRIAQLPKPTRLVATNEVARVRPDRDIARKPVVVTEKSLDRPVKPATQRALARDQRQIRRANDRQLNVDRQPLTAQNAPKPLRQRGQDRAAVQGGSRPEAVDGSNAAPTKPQQPGAVDREATRAERRAQRQQPNTPSQAASPPQRNAPAVDRQERRTQRQPGRQQQAPAAAPRTNRTPKADHVPVQRPNVAGPARTRSSSAQRPQAQQRVQQQPRAARAQAAPRQNAAAQQKRAARATSPATGAGKANGSGHAKRP